eukprot:CAMPEP_0172388596 /NCGR_PEP_ID=MMETSP1061-20121228/5668_1 /TAXON_ID=37318 /ORGANISM="Pseudo-nitzschia pungens, Strain cf. pungens" /LENGTH=409 /DNA_ID=CAMNT_0013118531 /DNA_START=1359 /DNA_END=2585 /DNA_ORIENTATION=+
MSARKKIKKSAPGGCGASGSNRRWVDNLTWARCRDESANRNKNRNRKETEKASEFADWTLIVNIQKCCCCAVVQAFLSESISERNSEEDAETDTPRPSSTIRDIEIRSETSCEEKAETDSVKSTPPCLTIDSEGAHDGVVSYSVHRCVLGMQSGYFRSVFASDSAEAQTRTTTICWPCAAISQRNFEQLLDFLYTGNLPKDVFANVAMAYLGNFFQINVFNMVARNLRKFLERRRSNRKDGKIKAALMVYADYLDLNEVVESIQRFYSGYPSLAVARSAAKFPYEFGVSFWNCVWNARENIPDEENTVVETWSEHLALFLKRKANRDVVELDVFHRLTRADFLPVISPVVAIDFMELEQHVLRSVTDCDGSELTCLQQRCTEALYDRKRGAWRLSQEHSTQLALQYRLW